ncbi:MAG TPA: 6-phosphofructokinase [Actinomycetaceae bacterium]|nr:6-phosphofructokinase [Actinomycetaceae bacterium]
MAEKIRIGFLTSGGDAPGMNAAVRAVVRAAIAHGAEPYAIYEGWQGAIEGGGRIARMEWSDASSIIDEGGTIIGTARSEAFRERSGMKTVVKNLTAHGIDRLVVIGGDGSLTGADKLRSSWPGLLEELVQDGELTQDVAAAHPELFVAGLGGSIDNDLVGSDSTIGADSALARILAAIDYISSTAASHQRTSIIEVMGRRCGYLALMSAMAGGCDYVLIPEMPPADGWEDQMIAKLRLGRDAGRRESIIIVAEGATDRSGDRIDSRRIAAALKDRAGIEARITILGHVQRGGTPTAYDRWMPTLLGYAAVQELLTMEPGDESHIIGVRRNRVARIPLVDAIKETHAVADAISEGRYDDAVAARGPGFELTLRIMETMMRPPAKDVRPQDIGAGKRVAILHAGGLAPGMNSAARAAVRLGLAHGYTMLGVEGGFVGLTEGAVRELSWAEVDSWATRGGANLGTRRNLPKTEHLYSMGRTIETHQIDGLILIGGHSAYAGAATMVAERQRFKAFDIPIVCVPASIDNNLPGADYSIGADTAVNNIVWFLDRVKASAAASRRCFVTETMGRHCGYLAQMAGIAAGAEYVYLHETGMTLEGILDDARRMRESFERGRSLFLVVRNEYANDHYSTDFLARAFEEEGGTLFDVRTNKVGHLQQGGPPSAYDRLLAVRLVDFALSVLDEQFETEQHRAFYVGGTTEKGLAARPLERMHEEVDSEFRRPLEEWWLGYRRAGATVAMPGAPIPEPLHIIDAEV